MPKKKAPELTDQERAKRIKEMAREVEADETGEAFKRALKRLSEGTRKRAARSR
jgi:ABC-type glutathione transport system ATPase component